MKKRILCYGDSNTYGYDPRTGYRYDSETRWTGVLARVLGEDFQVIEEGCNGRTTVFTDPREPWKTGSYGIQMVLNTHKPVDLVILMLGSNDLKNRFQASAAEIAQGAGTLVQEIQEFSALKQGYVPRLLLVSPPEIGNGIMKGSPFGGKGKDFFDESSVARSQQFKEEYRKVAEEYGCLFVAASDHILSSPADSLHLDPEAHDTLGHVLAEVILQEYEKKTVTKSQKTCETGEAADKLRRIIARLRDPETGCRWDKAQTLDSLKPCCVEEAVEVLAAIDCYLDTGSGENLKEELGDLLMQVVLQSQLAEEAGLFTLTDVIQGISEKMIRRHPHVFHLDDPANGDLEELIRQHQARDEEGNLIIGWDNIKEYEKRGKTDASAYLPAAFRQALVHLEDAKKEKEIE
ncbi:MAG: MazG nucleotide pyrophosphohydrolase domain-containing protein [Lachnospiraceae bacterium]|nr:MazG nucleotide pyrophosphohydrolase domain-containing protein [Lachnospiraceae bacterium]